MSLLFRAKTGYMRKGELKLNSEYTILVMFFPVAHELIDIATSVGHLYLKLMKNLFILSSPIAVLSQVND